MKGKIIEIREYFDEVEMKTKWLIGIVCLEEPKLKMGECEVYQK